MGRYIVGYEDRDTIDGRVIEMGALVPAERRIPICLEFDYTNPMSQMGWAEDFDRRVNEGTGFAEISFELYFSGDWEQRVIDQKLTPTCAMAAVKGPRIAYDQPSKLRQTVISSAQITAIGFSVGPNAWGEYPK